MRPSVLLALLAAVTPDVRTAPLPPEVDAFVRDRDLCDHFRGEPTEGNGPAAVARREFVRESVEIFCPGTDRRLAALKRRFGEDPAILKVLGAYEDRIGM